MHRLFVLFIVSSAIVVGCNRADTYTERQSDADQRVADRAQDAQEVDQAQADNTKKNQRDLDSDTKTPFDQGENEVDLGMTQQLRQEVVAADSLSLTAKNVKIITQDGVITLRGPVNSEYERTVIVELAKRIVGVKRVDNQLEVTADSAGGE